MNSLKAIQDLMLEKFGLKAESLTPDAMHEGLGLDSLSVLEFKFDMENELNTGCRKKAWS